MSYGISKDSIVGLVFFLISWLWGISTLIPADCMARRREILENGDNAVDTSDASLLRGFMCSLVKEGSTNRGSTTIEVLGYDSLLVEIKSVLFRRWPNNSFI